MQMTDYRKTFEAVTNDPRYQTNIGWGEPRTGHPEGSIRSHIAELEQNIDALQGRAALRTKLTDAEVWKLKLLVHTHDLFKGEAEPDVAIIDPRSHASLARKFLAEFCDDPDLLVMVQYHDEPFALYKKFEAKGKYNHKRFAALLNKIQDWDLFLAFNIVDGCTRGKDRKHLHWLFGELAGKVESRFTEEDLLHE
jgi:hypothetical protein